MRYSGIVWSVCDQGAGAGVAWSIPRKWLRTLLEDRGQEGKKRRAVREQRVTEAGKKITFPSLSVFWVEWDHTAGMPGRSLPPWCQCLHIKAACISDIGVDE